MDEQRVTVVKTEETRATPLTAVMSTPRPKVVSSMASLLASNSEPTTGSATAKCVVRTHPVAKAVVCQKVHAGPIVRRVPVVAATVVKEAASVVPAPAPTPAVSPAMVVDKKSVPQVVSSRKVKVAKLPDWQAKIATTFLMTADMSCTDDDIDMSLPENQRSGNPETDQITEDTTRCTCCLTHESEVMIQCDSCKKWLHEDCVRLANESEVFICIFCQYELAKSVKSYVRTRMSAQFGPMLQKCQTDCQAPAWNEMNDIVKDIQDVLQMIPMFLPSPDDERATEVKHSDF